jgi:hypothetical protein
MHKKIISIAVLLLGLSLFAQSAFARFTVHGVVGYHDPNSAQGPGIYDDVVGIPGATIAFLPNGYPYTPTFVTSGTNGVYSVTFDESQQEDFYYTVSCSAEGYEFDTAIVYEENTELFIIALQE